MVRRLIAALSVVAVVSAGWSAAASAGAEPETSASSTTPDAPQIGLARPGRKGGAKTAKIAWVRPQDQGASRVEKYQVFAFRIVKGKQRRAKKAMFDRHQRSAQFRLPKGKYRFSVRAKNSAGWSPRSQLSRTTRSR